MKVFVLAASAAGLVPADTAAQLSQVRSGFERLRSLVREVQPNREESRLVSTCGDIVSTVESVSRALGDVGATLALASGPHSSERNAPAAASAAVRKSLEGTAKNATALTNLIKEGKGRWNPVEEYAKELASRCSSVRAEFENGDERTFAAYQRALEDTRRWLQESLRAAQTLRENGAKPAEAAQKVEEQIEARMDEMTQRYNTAFHAWFAGQTRVSQARRNENDAFKRYQAVAAEPSSSDTADKVRSAASAWEATREATANAMREDFELFTAMERVAEERRRVVSELARVMGELRAFAKDATGDAVTRRWAEFDQWTKAFERDLGR